MRQGNGFAFLSVVVVVVMQQQFLLQSSSSSAETYEETKFQIFTGKKTRHFFRIFFLSSLFLCFLNSLLQFIVSSSELGGSYNVLVSVCYSGFNLFDRFFFSEFFFLTNKFNKVSDNFEQFLFCVSQKIIWVKTF